MSNKVKCSHILVEKQSQALELLEEIKKGKKFGAVAKETSTCPSGKKEGDLGYFENGTPHDPRGGIRNVIPGKGNYND